jgi:hypothetical protein
MEHDTTLSSLLKRHGWPARLRANEARVFYRGHEDAPVDGLEDVVLRAAGYIYWKSRRESGLTA